MGPGSPRVPVAVVCAIFGRVGQLSRRSVQCTTAPAALPRRGLHCTGQPATALAERAIARVSSADAARVPRRTVPDPKSSPPPFGELSGARHYRPGGCAPLPAPQRGASSGWTDPNCRPAPRRAGQFAKKSHPFSPVAQRELPTHPSTAPSGSFARFHCDGDLCCA